MFDKWLRLPAHLYLRITALTILTIGIAVSNVLMSIGAIWIIANWLIQADFKSYWENFKRKKSIWWIVAIYVCLAISISWSNDLAYGFKDLRIKLPFIVIPLVLATSAPLKKKHFYFLIYVFLGVVAYTSAYNFIRFNYVLESRQEIREMSVFISHVRLSVLINFAIFSCIYLIYKRKANLILCILAIGWYLFYGYKSQIINGYLLFLALLLFAVLFFIVQIKSKKLRASALSIVGVSIALISVLTVQLLKQRIKLEPIVFEELDKYSELGNPYYHDTTNNQLENGSYVWLYVNTKEMREGWEKRSIIRFDSLDNKGQPLYGTLMRYLTSKKSRKDAAGVAALSNEEVAEIENGKTSIELNKGLSTRFDAFLMEYEIYENGGDPNGHSLIQRIEHLKAAIGILRDKWMIGVGAGDVPGAFQTEYIKMESLLITENQHRSHNQFLTLWVGLGIVGLVLFLLVFISALIEGKPMDYFLMMTVIGLFISCLFQDLIETQAGVTIFALFYSLTLYRDKSEEEFK